MNKKISSLLLLAMLVLPGVFAATFDTPISSQDQSTFDQILVPVMKIYNFCKYTATVLAVVFLVFAGISFIMSGGDQAKRENAKGMATYIVIGLIVIWVAPLIVQYLVG